MKRPIQVTAAIIESNGKIFIARRAPNKHLAGYWEFPGGKIEKGESPEECLSRELEEELGIEVEVEGFFMDNVHSYETRDILLKAYHCKLKGGDLRLKDHDRFAWVNRKDMHLYTFAPADVPFIIALNGSD